MKKTIYSLYELLGIKAGLYGFDNIDFERSKDNILSEFKYQYKDKLSDACNKIGLKLHGIEYFSPHAYNFDTDSLDVTLSVVNKIKFKNHILKYKDEIQKRLDKNISYDGYIATTVDNVRDELDNLESKDYSPDVIVLSTILKHVIIIDFDYLDYLEYEPEEWC